MKLWWRCLSFKVFQFLWIKNLNYINVCISGLHPTINRRWHFPGNFHFLLHHFYYLFSFGWLSFLRPIFFSLEKSMWVGKKSLYFPMRRDKIKSFNHFLTKFHKEVEIFFFFFFRNDLSILQRIYLECQKWVLDYYFRTSDNFGCKYITWHFQI